MTYCILRTAKLKTLGNVSGSLSHTFRDRATDNADPARKRHNEVRDGRNASEVLAAIAGKLPPKRRPDAVLCIEYLVAASPEFFQNGESGADYFKAARQWLVDRHGAQNVVYWSVHRDEISPHMVAYVVPRVGNRLSAKHFLGGKAKLREMQTEFARKVGQPFGLRRGIEGSKAKHQTVAQFYAVMNSPAPVVPAVEISTPPAVFGRAAWAKTEAERLAEQFKPVLADAASVSGFARLQNQRNREAQATAHNLVKRAEKAEATARKLQADNQALQGAVQEWNGTYEAGLTADQVQYIIEMAEHMRQANRRAMAQNAAAPEPKAPRA